MVVGDFAMMLGVMVLVWGWRWMWGHSFFGRGNKGKNGDGGGGRSDCEGVFRYSGGDVRRGGSVYVMAVDCL